MNGADSEACVCCIVSFPCSLSPAGSHGGGRGGRLRVPSRWGPSTVHLPPQDLCERHEKGVLHKHQRALHKYSLMKRQMMSATVQSREPDSVEQLESRIVEVVLARGVGEGAWAAWVCPAGLGCAPGLVAPPELDFRPVLGWLPCCPDVAALCWGSRRREGRPATPRAVLCA